MNEKDIKVYFACLKKLYTNDGLSESEQKDFNRIMSWILGNAPSINELMASCPRSRHKEYSRKEIILWMHDQRAFRDGKMTKEEIHKKHYDYIKTRKHLVKRYA